MRTTTAPRTRLLGRYLRPERRPLRALTAVLVVAMLLPVAGPVLIGRFVDDAAEGRNVSGLLAIAGAYLAVALAGDLLQLFITWRSVGLAWRIGNRLRTDLAAHALDHELAWHGERSPGLLIERIDGDIEAITTFTSTAVLQLAGNAILLAGVLVVSVAIDWRAGLLIAVCAAIAVALMARLRVASVPAHDAEREVQGRLYGDLEERLGGLEDLRANGAGHYAVHRLHQHSSQWWHAARRASFLGDGAYVAAAAAFGIGSAATLGLGVWLHRGGDLSVGSVLVLFRFSQLVREPLERIAEQLSEFQRALAGARRAAELLADRPTMVDGPRPGVAPADLPAGPLAVDLDDAGLDYDLEPGGTVAAPDATPPAGDRPALAGVDLHLAPGTVLGVVGRTGSGKTTLGRLMARLWDATEGTVRVGGIDVRDLGRIDLRRRVAVVTQEVDLLRASVRDNLTLLGAIDADDATLRAVLDEVGLGPWSEELADGLDTEVAGTGGLSAGEAQLLAFARVLLVDPGLVVLDEASSRLDPATEARVTAAVARLLAGRTVVVIAHRLSTLERADEIMVVDAGRVVEHGPRAALAADSSSAYARLLAAAGDQSLASDAASR